MKSLILSLSDSRGGAARAALRLHQALLADGQDSHMLVRERLTDVQNIAVGTSPASKATALLRPRIGNMAFKLGSAPDMGVRSGNWVPSRWSSRVNELKADVLNLHWVNGEALSIADIGRIRQPIVWTLHDMWAFCGSEHYAPDHASARWRVGYLPENCPIDQHGLDLDRWVWGQKRKHWRRPMHIVAPSRWLAECAKASALFCEEEVTCIPNPLDTNVFRPLDRAFSRDALGLPQDVFLAAFGAMGGTRDPRKGFDLLREAMDRIALFQPSLAMQGVVFGQFAPRNGDELPMTMHWLGHIHDDVTLALLYSAVDVMVVPSRQENLPQTATEAQACGCPVLAFDCTGLPDAVEHRVTGYLARAFDVEDLTRGLAWIHEDRNRQQQLRVNARRRAERLWSRAVIVPQYRAVYAQIMQRQT